MFIGVTNYCGSVAFVIVGETIEEVKADLEATSDYEDFPYTHDDGSEILIFKTRQADEVIMEGELTILKNHCGLVEKLINDDGDLSWVSMEEKTPSEHSIEDFTVELP